MRKFFFYFTVLYFNFYLFALPSDKEKALVINADSVFLDQMNGIGHYEGHVWIQQGSTHIQGKEMFTYFNKQHQLIKVIIKGDKTKKAFYKTQPQIHKVSVIASAYTITFLTPEQHIILEGNAKAEQGDDHIEGPYLEYDMLKQQFKAHHSHMTLMEHTQQTTIVIQPNTLSTSPTLQHLNKHLHNEENTHHA